MWFFNALNKTKMLLGIIGNIRDLLSMCIVQNINYVRDRLWDSFVVEYWRIARQNIFPHFEDPLEGIFTEVKKLLNNRPLLSAAGLPQDNT